MLESLRQIAVGNQGGKRRNNTIIYMAFDHEEYDSLDNGLIGSKFAIEQWLMPWLTKNYGQHWETLKPHGIIVLDTVMNYNSSAQSQIIPPESEPLAYFPKTVSSLKSDQFQGDFLAAIFRQNLDGNLASTFNSEWLGEPQPEFEIEKFGIDYQNVSDDTWNLFNDFFRSDHVNFWKTNIPAIFITDSANFRGQMQQCYHNACDNLTNILTDNNVRFLGKTADTIAATLDKLSEAYNTNPSSASCNGDFISILRISIGLMLVMI
ncbi:hypothetical protein MAR_007388 [Mya arenaria]|uniref:Peptidase M28 domain-containing protein n=1 Tax=Mya arenaria TaxID=6604 RepID=A0ABY7DB88_MYAAR|nr:hypothetical protein MAR_007388 [Mya arenaria]